MSLQGVVGIVAEGRRHRPGRLSGPLDCAL